MHNLAKELPDGNALYLRPKRRSFTAHLDKRKTFHPSESWTEEHLQGDLEDNRKRVSQASHRVENPETDKGVRPIIAGNMSTLLLMPGTEYWPDVTGEILLGGYSSSCGAANGWGKVLTGAYMPHTSPRLTTLVTFCANESLYLIAGSIPQLKGDCRMMLGYRQLPILGISSLSLWTGGAWTRKFATPNNTAANKIPSPSIRIRDHPAALPYGSRYISRRTDISFDHHGHRKGGLGAQRNPSSLAHHRWQKDLGRRQSCASPRDSINPHGAHDHTRHTYWRSS